MRRRRLRRCDEHVTRRAGVRMRRGAVQTRSLPRAPGPCARVRVRTNPSAHRARCGTGPPAGLAAEPQPVCDIRTARRSGPAPRPNRARDQCARHRSGGADAARRVTDRNRSSSPLFPDTPLARASRRCAALGRAGARRPGCVARSTLAGGVSGHAGTRTARAGTSAPARAPRSPRPSRPAVSPASKKTEGRPRSAHPVSAV